MAARDIASLTIKLSSARRQHRPQLVELQRRPTAAGYPPHLARKLEDQPALIDQSLKLESFDREQVLIAEIAGRLVGFATVVGRGAEDAAELDALFVEPADWRKGIGTALLRGVERKVREQGVRQLFVLANPLALPFYTVNGFVEAGRVDMLLEPAVPLLAKPIL